MKAFLRFGSLLCLTLWTSCQPSPSQSGPRLYGELYVRYLASERQLKAEASFLEGDSLADARPVSFEQGISFLGSGMVPRSLPGEVTRYQYQEKLDYPESFRFGLIPPQGERVEVEFSMEPLGDFTIDGEVSKTSGFTLRAQGSTLSDEESLILLFSDANNKANTIILKGPSEKIQHTFLGKQLSGFALGKHQLYLVKKRQSTLENDWLSANAVIEYYTAIQQVDILP